MRGARDPIERGVRLLCAPFGGDAHRERGDDSRPQAQSIRLMCDRALKIRVESQVQITGLPRATKTEAYRPRKSGLTSEQSCDTSVSLICTFASQFTYLAEATKC